jgi:hypothetical protein
MIREVIGLEADNIEKLVDGIQTIISNRKVVSYQVSYAVSDYQITYATHSETHHYAIIIIEREE